MSHNDEIKRKLARNIYGQNLVASKKNVNRIKAANSRYGDTINPSVVVTWRVIYLHTALLASFEADASAKMNFRHGIKDLNISSLSSEAPSWTSRRTIQLAAATCSSPLPRFRHRSKESHIVTLLKRPNSCHLSIRFTSIYILLSNIHHPHKTMEEINIIFKYDTV